MAFLIKRREQTKPFSAIRQEDAPRKISIDTKRERITSVIAKGAVLEGNLTYAEGVKVDGRVRGTLRFGCEDGLGIVAPGGLVEGNFIGPKGLILGEVQGDVEVEGVLVIGATGTVVGDIRCGRLVVADGAGIEGTMSTIRKTSSTKQIEAESSMASVDDGARATADDGRVVQFRGAM